MVLELFDGGSVLISDIKSGQQFKVNDHRLKPYMTSKPPAPADKVNDGELFIYMNTRVLSEPILLLLISFKKLSIHLMDEQDLSKSLKRE